MDALTSAVASFLAKIAGYLGAAGAGALYQKKADEDAEDKKTAADLGAVQRADAASRNDTLDDAKAYLKKQGLLK